MIAVQLQYTSLFVYAGWSADWSASRGSTLLCTVPLEMMVVKGISASLMCVVTTVSIDWPLPVL